MSSAPGATTVGRSSAPRAAAYTTVPFPRVRRGNADLQAAARRRHIVHGLFEIDVTEARRWFRELRTGGVDCSFTAFVLHAVAQAVQEQPIMHGYRRRDQVMIFADVDVNTQIEARADGQPFVLSLVIRAANRKSVAELTREIRDAQHQGGDAQRRYRQTLGFLSLPRPLRALTWRLVMAEPALFKRLGGTIAVSAIGMFGPAGGWGIPSAPATLCVTVGGIARKPRFVDGRLAERELLGVTLSVDHAVVDGATVARFARRLTELIEQGDGLGR